MRPLNFGRQILTIPGITGVSAGGTAQVQINPNRRVSRMNFQTTGIAFVAPVLTLPGATTQPVLRVTLSDGVIDDVVIVSAACAGVADGTYALAITDNIVLADGTLYNLQTSFDAVIHCAVATNVVTSVTIFSGGTIGPVPPEIFFGGQLLLTVGGVNMSDLSATQIKAAALADDSSVTWETGEFNFDFVKPSARFTSNPDLTIFDLWGQSVMQLQMPITRGITSPSVVGVYEFDADISLRNTASINGQIIPILQPIARHSQSFPVPAGAALFSITTVPFLINPSTPLPIARLYFQESDPGNITKLEIDADGNKIVQLDGDQLKQMYAKYGFNTDIFGAMFASDYNRRIANSLRCATSLVIYVSSAVTQNVTIIRETLPGAYSGG